MSSEGSTIRDVDSPLPPASRPYDLLVQAVETHAALRDGAPHPGEQEAEPNPESTLGGNASGGARRAPTRRKKT